MTEMIQQVSLEEIPIPVKDKTVDSRLPGLDMLRFIAVVLVLGHHMPPPRDWPHIPKLALLFWTTGGWVGVDLFFVLSGFLVSGLLFREYKSRGRFSIGRFYVRRGWKIYPPFLALVATTVAAQMLIGTGVSKRSLVSEIIFIQCYVPGLWIHTWSLAVEEHFYLLLPLLLYFILKLNVNSAEPLRPVVLMAFCVAAFCLVLRLINWNYNPSYIPGLSYDRYVYHFPSILRLDSLFFGVAISYQYHFHTDWFVKSFFRWRAWLIVGGVLVLLPAFIFPLDSMPGVFTTVGLTCFYLASGAILAGILLCRVRRSPLVIAAATLGSYSYSIYLWHLPVQSWGVRAIERASGLSLGFEAKTTIYLLGSIVIGIAMAKIIELPALRIRDAWFPSHADAGTPRQTQLTADIHAAK